MVDLVGDGRFEAGKMAGSDFSEDDLVVMGEIAGAYGVRGEVRVHNYDALPVGLLDVAQWRLRRADGWRVCRVETVRVHGDHLVAGIEGVDDREAAAALRGTPVAVLRTELPEIGDDAFYWFELVGMAVVNRTGEALGQVVGLIDSPANDVLRVVDGTGRERLIPMVGALIDRIDRQTRTIVVDWGADWD